MKPPKKGQTARPRLEAGNHISVLYRDKKDMLAALEERTADLARTNELLSQLFVGEGLVLAYLDPDFNIVRTSLAWAQLCGKTPEELSGKNYFELFPEARVEGIFRKVVETAEAFQASAGPFPGGGSLCHVEGYWDWNLQPVKGPGGRVAGLVLLLNNVTKRKEAEEKLSASSLYARRLLEASLDPLVTISPAGKITDVNEATEFVTGFSREVLIGSDFSNYFTEPAKAREGYERVFSQGSVKDYPLAIRHVSGQVTEVLYNATVYRGERGEIQGVFAAARDITEQKKAEEENLLLAKALEQAAEGVVIMDSDGMILYVNPAFERMNGLPSGQVLGKKYSEIPLRPEPASPRSPQISDILARGEVWSGHFNLNRADGRNQEVDVVISPILDPERGVRNFVAVERDVTEEVNLQNLIRQRQKMEALGTLAGGVAHDFNNILMPILINAEVGLDEKNLTADSIRRLEMILQAARRGRDLVKQIIAFSRPKDQERRPIEIGSIIREASKFLRASIPKNIEIRENVADPHALALADPTQIHQVLINLCSNAAYAMRDKGGTLDLSLEVIEIGPEAPVRFLDLKPGSYLRLSVSDTGEGMRPEIMDKIFDPFFTTKQTGEGAGMGLPVVHGIVKGHGGEISVTSEMGRGTTFHVYLPRVSGEEAAPVETLKPLPGGTERIIFLDDEDIHVRTIVPMLRRLGYRVEGMTDPLRVLEFLRKDPGAFDLLITDQTMPRLTGVELAREIADLRQDLPIILCTGFSDTSRDGVAHTPGIRAVLTKPFSVREIAEAIRNVLENRA